MEETNNKTENMSATTPANSNNTPQTWGTWFINAQQQATEFAIKAQENFEIAKKIATEKAIELAKNAEEMRQNYDMEVATSILMGTVGGPINTMDKSSLTRGNKQSVKDLDLVYVTENIISMTFPYEYEKLLNGNIDNGNDIDVVSSYLKKRHSGHFMVWNISEESYDYSKFNDQVLEYKFPGHPSPPLGLLFKICTSIESWLDADEQNIAVIHCLTGKGRTAALMACVLAWLGEFTSPMESLQYIAERRGYTVDNLTIPSQRRYVQYFSNMLDGVKPRSEPLLLRRVIINAIPLFGTEKDGSEYGCCPYIQLFKNGKLIATAAAQGSSSSNQPQQNDNLTLRWIKGSEGSASFTIDCAVQGDILLRCRHAARTGVRISMFRCGFHTGYVPSGVLRLTKAQLDGSCSDARYEEDFFIDLIFAPIQTIVPENVNTSSTIASTTPTENVTDSGLTLDAVSTDKFEMSLHKDSKFWESISTRKQKAKKRKSRKYLSTQQERFSIADDINNNDMNSNNTLEMNFYSSFTTTNSSNNSNTNSSKNQNDDSNNISDLDLIKQLVELESGRDNNKMNTIDNNTTTTNNNNNNDYKITNTSNELQILEELEKELGLDSFLLNTNNTTNNTSNSNTSNSNTSNSNNIKVNTTMNNTITTTSNVTSDNISTNDNDIDNLDNLDELEKYLQSLSSS